MAQFFASRFLTTTTTAEQCAPTPSPSTASSSGEDVSELKKDLVGWRWLLPPLSRVLTWAHPHHPAVLFGATSLLFGLIWVCQPTVLTTLALIGLLLTAVDFAVLFISPYVFASKQWTEEQEVEFEGLCEGILSWRNEMTDLAREFSALKTDRPTVYFVVVMGLLSTVSWIGYIMNNLLLTYVIVLTFVMYPGLRKTGWIHRYFLKYWLIFRRLVFGRFPGYKSKAN